MPRQCEKLLAGAGTDAGSAAADMWIGAAPVGTGLASLTVNGTRVKIEPNGTIAAFLPLPAGGVFLHLAAPERTRTWLSGRGHE